VKILLDTHAVLWWLNGDPKFSQQAMDLISDPTNDILVSFASLWEMLVKARTGKLTVNMQKLMSEMQNQGFQLLGIELAHLLVLEPLPRTHKDPWDHMLIAQAIAEEAVFMSEDGYTPNYPVNYVKCSGAQPPQMGG
jgi:PIN domain nuclease of toxin-antitoxin system